MKNDAELNIRLPSELKHELCLEAARKERSMAQIVIKALRYYFETASKAKKSEGK